MAEAQARSAISDEEVAALLEKNHAEGVRPFNISAHRINRAQLPMLEILCKTFAERAGVSLSGLIGREAGVQFESLETARAADLQAALPVPMSLAVVRIKPLEGLAFVSVEPELLLALMDGFFGGSGRALAGAQAAAAPAAQRFLGLMIRSYAADLAAAWAPLTPVELELVKQESNPRFVQMGGSLDGIIVAKFVVEFGERHGRMDWLLPESLLAPIREALAADGGTGSGGARAQEPWAPALGVALQAAQLETRAILAQTAISLGELVRLAPGDIIPIDAPSQATLLAGNVPLYRGRFGISQGRNALKILPGDKT
jgi:flagellar motor switch protein FliM